MPLPEIPERLKEVGQRIVDWFHRPTGTTDAPPYQVYAYSPRNEWDIRRALRDLGTWLAAPGREVPCQSISLAAVFWKLLDESGWTEEIFEQERAAAANPTAQAEIHRAVAELLRAPEPFSHRVQQAIENATKEPTAVFLYRAGSLYPVFRTSGLLDDLRPRLKVPVTLMYPGELRGDFGLRFMGKWEPTYNYRALIVDGT